MSIAVVSVSLEQYLAASYRPDVGYVAGQLKKKPIPTLLHGFVQALIASWFLSYIDEWNIIAATETRTQIDENRVRLPDVVVVGWSEFVEGALISPPLIAIEILSPTNAYADLQERAADLSAMGVGNIWLINPQWRTAETWNGKNWQFFEGNRLTAVNAPIYLDLEWLWAKVDKKKLLQR